MIGVKGRELCPSPKAVIGSSARDLGLRDPELSLGRCRFDKALLEALDTATHPRPLTLDLVVSSNSSNGGGPVTVVLRPRVVAPCQVVLLGAGMDSRAWRLPLPEGAYSVVWFIGSGIG